MKKRRSLTRKEQVTTIEEFLREKRWTQTKFLEWLEDKGVIITQQYLGDVLHGRRHAGPKFKAVFYAITKIKLVDGWIEEDKR